MALEYEPEKPKIGMLRVIVLGWIKNDTSKKIPWRLFFFLWSLCLTFLYRLFLSQFPIFFRLRWVGRWVRGGHCSKQITADSQILTLCLGKTWIDRLRWGPVKLRGWSTEEDTLCILSLHRLTLFYYHVYFFTADENIPAKILSYNRANRAVAILCNHQRAPPKTFEKSMMNLQSKVSWIWMVG